MKKKTRQAEKKQKAAYAIIVRSLIAEGGGFISQKDGRALLEKCRLSESECSTKYAPPEAIELLREYDQALQTLQEYAEFKKDVDLVDLVIIFRKELRLQAGQFRTKALNEVKSFDNDLNEPLLMQADLGNIDVSGLESREASTLALRLSKYNKKPFYKKYQGKRVLAARTVNLNDPWIKSAPFYDDLLDIYRSNGYEDLRR